MMSENELLRMYHAWQQGNEEYTKQWMNFVEWAANWNKTNNEEMINQLLKYRWFKHE
jgi:hypothetical protein